MSVRLSDIRRCFQGVVPSIIATADAHGLPNVVYVSQVYFVDDRHVALSCQFFSKTRRNLDENPVACAEVTDPITLQAYRLRLKFLRSERSGPLFDTMSLRIDAIASHTGMAGVFRLIAADVFEVVCAEMVAGFLTDAPVDAPEGASLEGMRTEMRGLQWVSERVNRATTLESLLGVVLEALEEYFNFSHTSILLHDEANQRLTTIASRGYGESGVGAEVALGEGLIGTVARERRLLRLTSLDTDLRYGRAIRREAAGGSCQLQPEIPLPGLPDAQSVLAIPLTIGERLIGVIAAEDRDPMRFSEWHEAYLEILANQIALGIDRMIERCDEPADGAPPPAPAPASGRSSRQPRQMPSSHLLPPRRCDFRGRRIPDSQHPRENSLEGARRIDAHGPHRVLQPGDARRPVAGAAAGERQPGEPLDPAETAAAGEVPRSADCLDGSRQVCAASRIRRGALRALSCQPERSTFVRSARLPRRTEFSCSIAACRRAARHRGPQSR